MNLAEAVAVYVEGRAARGEISPVTAAHFRTRLASLVAVDPAASLDDIDRRYIADWQARIGGQRPASRRAYLSTVKTFCRWAIAEDLLTTDPTVAAARIREPRRPPRTLSAAAVARLALVLPDRRAEVIVALMFGAGLRCVEVARLAVADYDRAAATIDVTGKNGDGRILPVRADLAGLLAGWIGDRQAGPVVGITAGRISVLVSRWMAAAGIKTTRYDGISAHALRHTFAANTLRRCRNVRTVQTALGHQSLATTQRYLPWADLDELRAAMAEPA